MAVDVRKLLEIGHLNGIVTSVSYPKPGMFKGKREQMPKLQIRCWAVSHMVLWFESV